MEVVELRLSHLELRLHTKWLSAAKANLKLNRKALELSTGGRVRCNEFM